MNRCPECGYEGHMPSNPCGNCATIAAKVAEIDSHPSIAPGVSGRAVVVDAAHGVVAHVCDYLNG